MKKPGLLNFLMQSYPDDRIREKKGTFRELSGNF